MESEERDIEAFGAFAANHGQALVTIAYLLCGDSEEAQDIVQAVLGRLLASRRLDMSDHPMAYARRAVTNEFIDRGRRRSRLTHLLVTLRSQREPGVAFDVQIADRDALLRAFSVLSRRERAAVVLRYYEGWDDDGIAKSLGCAPATVRSLISRAMPKLRAELVEARHHTEED